MYVHMYMHVSLVVEFGSADSVYCQLIPVICLGNGLAKPIDSTYTENYSAIPNSTEEWCSRCFNEQ